LKILLEELVEDELRHYELCIYFTKKGFHDIDLNDGLIGLIEAITLDYNCVFFKNPISEEYRDNLEDSDENYIVFYNEKVDEVIKCLEKNNIKRFYELLAGTGGI